jgi:glycerate 2-kinase
VSIISNINELGTTTLRKVALSVAERGLSALDSRRTVQRNLKLKKNIISVGGKDFPISLTSKIFVIGVGKCAIEAGFEMENILGDRLTGGIILDVHENNLCKFKKIECFSGTHPMPTSKNIQVTKKIVELLSPLSEEDLVLLIISGGGSTLLCLPEENFTCVEESDIVQQLFKAGATIEELNTVRKHLSFARGGYLAKYAYPARVASIIFSDVPGNNISIIASGPTVKDVSTIENARSVLKKYNIFLDFEKGLIETPKEDKYFGNVYNFIALSNENALKEMAKACKELGFNANIKTTELVGEARIVGKKIITEIKEAVPGTVYLYGGETIVKVNGRGRGGRNQELALATLNAVDANTLILTLASDGKDNGPYAGAIIDIGVKENALKQNLKPHIFLDENNSSEFFEKTNNLLKTGNTGSNVSDLIIAIKNK